jgi:hypothetical protein
VSDCMALLLADDNDTPGTISSLVDELDSGATIVVHLTA